MMQAATATKRNAFGFTNSQADLDRVTAWRDAAIADGWNHEPTYGQSEGEDRACRLTRDGFVAQVISRKPVSLRLEGGKWLAEAQVSTWGPDGMSISIPEIYDWTAIKLAAETCNYCGSRLTESHRVAFAGRACATCAPKEQAKLPRNWAD